MHKKNYLISETEQTEIPIEKSYTQFWSQKKAKNIVIHGIINFIHKKNKETKKKVGCQKNGCFVEL